MNDPLPSADPDRTVVRDPSENTNTLDATADSTRPKLPPPPADAPAIPGYRITGEIAKGGMGKVYAAHHLTLDREAAIKTLLPGANADRFVTESKITAKLPHPNIPPVYELGTLPDGRPFLAMKLVRGQTLSAQLKARPTPAHDLPRFVHTFEQVAQAVGFAHSRGVLHRDLKPLNVMVGEFGEVQVMDWGLAREVGNAEWGVRNEGGETADGSSTPHSAFPTPHLTMAGAIMGTPGYMAPEQARAEPLDPRADVFALGATLAAILTGKPAFVGNTPVEAVQKAGRAELSDVFARLDACGADAELIALAKRCLAADRDARPADGRAVATEVAAYRAGVEARLKQAETDRAEAVVREGEQRKQRRQFNIAAGVVVGVLLAGIVGVVIALLEAQRQEVNAKYQEGVAKGETAKKEEARKAEEAAKVDAQEAQRIEAQERAYALAIAGLMKDDFLALTSVEGQGRFGGRGLDRKATLLDLLERAAAKLDARKGLDPRTEAEMCWIIGVSYRGTGRAAKGVPYLERAVKLRCEALGDDHAATLDAMNSLAASLSAAGEYDAAVALHHETLGRLRSKLGPDHPDTIWSMGNLARGYQGVGKLDLAESLTEEVARLTQAHFGPDHSRTHRSMSDLAEVYRAVGKLDKAVPLAEEALKLQKAKLDADHPDTLATMNHLANIYYGTGQSDKALPVLQEALELGTEKLGPDHPETLTSLHNLGLVHLALGQSDKAVPIQEEARRLSDARLGPDHPDSLAGIVNLGAGYLQINQPDKAVPLLERARLQLKTKLGEDHPTTLAATGNLAAAYLATGRGDKGLPLYEEAIRRLKTKLGEDHPTTLTATGNLAEGYQETGRADKAVPLLEGLLPLRKKRFGPDHPKVVQTIRSLAMAYEGIGQPDKALPVFEEAFKLGTEKLGKDHHETLTSMQGLGLVYLTLRRPDKALPILEEACRLSDAKFGKDHPDSLLSTVNLATGYLEVNRPDKAVPLLERAREQMKTRFGEDHPKTLTAVLNLAAAHLATGRGDKGLPLYEEAIRLLKKKFGPDYPTTHKAVSDLAEGYMVVGRADKAVPLFEEVLPLRKGRDGADHPNTLQTMRSLAVAYERTGRPEKGVLLFEEALKLTKEKHGPDHPTTVAAMNSLAMSYHVAGQSDKAVPLFEQALEMRKAKLGAGHPETLKVMGNLGKVCADLKQGEKAAAHLTSFVDGYRDLVPKDSTEFAVLLTQVSQNLMQCDQFATAEKMLRECLAIREKKTPDAWSTSDTRTMLGAAVLRQKKYEDAEPLLVKGYEGLKEREQDIPAEGRVERLSRALDKLVELYTATDKPDEVKKYRELRAKYPVAKKDVLPPPRADK